METPTPSTTDANDRTNTDLQQLLARMTPERRVLYNRIIQRRDRIGAVEHDLVASLAEMRGNG
jgi:hypothetical protein